MSATLSGSLAEERVQGAAMSAKAKEIVAKVKTGQKVYLENIKAKGPDGRNASHRHPGLQGAVTVVSKTSGRMNNREPS